MEKKELNNEQIAFLNDFLSQDKNEVISSENNILIYQLNHKGDPKGHNGGRSWQNASYLDDLKRLKEIFEILNFNVDIGQSVEGTKLLRIQNIQLDNNNLKKSLFDILKAKIQNSNQLINDNQIDSVGSLVATHQYSDPSAEEKYDIAGVEKREFTMDPTGEFEHHNKKIQYFIALETSDKIKLGRKRTAAELADNDFAPLSNFQNGAVQARRKVKYSYIDNSREYAIYQEIKRAKEDYKDPIQDKSAFKKTSNDSRRKKIVVLKDVRDENGNFVRNSSGNIMRQEQEITATKGIKTTLKNGKQNVQNEKFEVLNFTISKLIKVFGGAYYQDLKNVQVGSMLIDPDDPRTEAQYQNDLKNALEKLDRFISEKGDDFEGKIDIDIKDSKGEIHTLSFGNIDAVYDFLKIPGREIKIDLVGDSLRYEQNSNSQNSKFKLGCLEKIISLIYEIILKIFGKQKEFNEMHKNQSPELVKSSLGQDPSLKDKILFNNFVDLSSQSIA